MPNRSPGLAFFLRRAALGIATVLPPMGLLAWPAQAVPLYRLTDLTALFGDSIGGSSGVNAINDQGQMVGFLVDTDANRRATLFDPTDGGASQDLGTLGGTESTATDINNQGQIVGEARTPDGASHATLFDPTGAGDNTDLDPLGGEVSSALAINDRGQIVGRANDPASGSLFDIQATLLDPTGGGDNTRLGTLGVPFSVARDINNQGQIVGDEAGDLESGRATLFDPTGGGDNRDLGAFGDEFAFSSASAINDRGQIVGLASRDGVVRATLFDPTGAGDNQDLGALTEPNSSARAISNAGQIVGSVADIVGGTERAFLFEAGTMFDLNDLIDPNDPLFDQALLQVALDINASGVILTRGVITVGFPIRDFLLTPVQVQPVPEPATLALLVVGVAGLGLPARRRWA